MSLKKSIIQALKFIAFLAAGIFLLYLTFRNINFAELAKKLAHASYGWLLLSIVFSTFAYLSRTRRWVLLINPLGYNPHFKNTFYAMMTGYLANMALPRIGEITRCIALGRKEKIPTDQLFGTVIIERAIDLFSLLIITVIMLFAEGHLLGPFLINNVYKPMSEKITDIFGYAWIIWIMLLASCVIISYLTYRFRKSLRRIRFFAKIFDALKGLITGLKTITTVKHKWEFVFHTLFIWINYALMTWVVLFSIESTSHLTLTDGIFLLVIGGLAMSAPVQSGLGAFHFVISRGLYAIYGISIEDGLVYSLLSHESQLIYGAVLGLISFYALVKKTK
ncbi:MAG: lysylphosphatidylglycerol synthase transmembrane domain-containing protein [Bacteroidales bacterium]